MFRICAFLRLTIQQKRILNLLIPVECGKLFERINNLHHNKTELDFFYGLKFVMEMNKLFFAWRRYRKTQNSLVNWHNNDRSSSLFNTIFESTAALVQMKTNVFAEN